MENLTQSAKHLFNNSEIDQSVAFKIDIIKLICQLKKPQIALRTKQVVKYQTNPTKFLLAVKDNVLKSIQQQIQSTIQNELNKQTQSINLKKKQYWLKKKLINFSVVFVSIPYTKAVYKTFNRLKSDDIGKWILITGTIIQSTQKKTLQKSKIFICTECGCQYRINTTYHNSYRFQLPSWCSNMVQKNKSQNFFGKLYQNFYRKKAQSIPKNQQKQEPQLKTMKCGNNKFQPSQNDSCSKICIDYQQLRIQQPFKHILSGKMPQNITVILEGDMTGNFRPGDDITVSGLLTYRYKKSVKDVKLQPQLIIHANNINIQKIDRSIQSSQTQKSISDAKRYANFPLNYYQQYNLNSNEKIIIKQLQFRNQIIKSFCPTIYGRHMVKLGLILALLGGVQYQNESTKIRGHSHILLVGQPGTGKSVLLQFAAKIAERSFFTNGIGTTSAGLSVSYYKQGGDWMIEAGALVLADNGVCCIDQLSLLSKNDEKALLEAMQQQTISSAKASVLGKLNARTKVIAACNPITPNQKYDDQLDLQKNTGLSVPLLTRFDLIMILKDQQQVVEDSMKCDFVLSKFTNQSYKPLNLKKPVSNSQLSQYDETNPQSINIKVLLRKCKVFTPDLDDTTILSVFYTNQRLKQERGLTVRAFQSLCRLSQAHAKLMMRDKTSLFDCVTAIMLLQNKYISTIEEYYAFLDDFNQKNKTNFST